MLPQEFDLERVATFHAMTDDSPTSTLIHTVESALLNFSAYRAERWVDVFGVYQWRLTHYRHPAPVIVTLQAVTTPDEPAMRSLVIAVEGSESSSVLVTDPHRMVTHGIVTTVLRNYGLAGII